MTGDDRKVTVLMEQEEAVAYSKGCDQAVDGASNGDSPLSKVSIDIGSIFIIRELYIDFRKEK